MQQQQPEDSAPPAAEKDQASAAAAESRQDQEGENLLSSYSLRASATSLQSSRDEQQQLQASSAAAADEEHSQGSSASSATVAKKEGGKRASSTNTTPKSSSSVTKKVGANSSIWKLLQNAQIFRAHRSGNKKGSSSLARHGNRNQATTFAEQQDLASCSTDSLGSHNTSGQSNAANSSSLSKSSTQLVTNQLTSDVSWSDQGAGSDGSAGGAAGEKSNMSRKTPSDYEFKDSIIKDVVRDEKFTVSKALDNSPSSKLLHKSTSSIPSAQHNASFDTESLDVNLNSDRDQDYQSQMSQQSLQSESPRVARRFAKALKKFINSRKAHYEANPLISIWMTQLSQMAHSCIEALENDELTLPFLYGINDKIDSLIHSIQESKMSNIGQLVQDVKTFSIMVAKPTRIVEIIEQGHDDFQLQADYILQHYPDQTEDLIKYIIRRSATPIDFIKKEVMDDLDQSSQLRASFLDYQNSIKLEDFHYVKDLGQGKYGKTSLVAYKDTNLHFALKSVKKSHVSLKEHVNKLFTERDIHFYLKSVFVVKLYCTFVSDQSVYFLMEYIKAGDISTYLDRGLQFTPETTLKITKQIVLAIEFLHLKDIVHRDLKPGNILLTENFNIKLTDFGLSDFALKYELHDYSNQSETGHFVGTPYYIAPEVILNKPSGKPFDWWAVGIIAYEMQIGTPPFMGKTIDEIFNKIVHDEVEWPEDILVDPLCKDFIICLLIKDPELRLGTNGTNEVKEHLYFSLVDWIVSLKHLQEAHKKNSSHHDHPKVAPKINEPRQSQTLTRAENLRSEARVKKSHKKAKKRNSFDAQISEFTYVSKDIVELINRSTGDDDSVNQS